MGLLKENQVCLNFLFQARRGTARHLAYAVPMLTLCQKSHSSMRRVYPSEVLPKRFLAESQQRLFRLLLKRVTCSDCVAAFAANELGRLG